MRIRFPEPEEIKDPTPKLPGGVAKEIRDIITKAVARSRTQLEATGTFRFADWGEDAVLIFKLLAGGRLKQTYPDADALRQALNQDAEVALTHCIHWVNRQVLRGYMPSECHEQIEARLNGEVEVIVTDWWKLAADADTNPTAPSTPPPTRTRAPQTKTRECVEAYLNGVEEKTGVKVDKTDFWCRPTKADGTSWYSSDREFRAFQQEDPGLSPGIRKKFLDVLKMSPETFVVGRDGRRPASCAKRQKKDALRNPRIRA